MIVTSVLPFHLAHKSIQILFHTRLSGALGRSAIWPRTHWMPIAFFVFDSGWESPLRKPHSRVYGSFCVPIAMRDRVWPSLLCTIAAPQDCLLWAKKWHTSIHRLKIAIDAVPPWPMWRSLARWLKEHNKKTKQKLSSTLQTIEQLKSDDADGDHTYRWRRDCPNWRCQLNRCAWIIFCRIMCSKNIWEEEEIEKWFKSNQRH